MSTSNETKQSPEDPHARALVLLKALEAEYFAREARTKGHTEQTCRQLKEARIHILELTKDDLLAKALVMFGRCLGQEEIMSEVMVATSVAAATVAATAASADPKKAN